MPHLEFTVDVSLAVADLERFQRLLPSGRSSAASAIARVGKRSIRRFVPIFTKNLWRKISTRILQSGRVIEFYSDGVAYAAKQNFVETYNHATAMNPTGERGAHFMERGMIAAAEDAGTIIQQMHVSLWKPGYERQFATPTDADDYDTGIQSEAALVNLLHKRHQTGDGFDVRQYRAGKKYSDMSDIERRQKQAREAYLSRMQYVRRTYRYKRRQAEQRKRRRRS